VVNIDQRRQTRNAPGRDACDVGAFDTGGTMPITAAPVITAPASTSATVSSPASVTVKATGSPTPGLSESGALPSGVTFSDQGTGAGLLSGTPAPGTAGSYPITITAANGNGSATKSLVLSVVPLGVSRVAPASIGAGAIGIPVTVTGTGFRRGAGLTASDPGISFSAVVAKNGNTITALASIAPDVPSGTYDVAVSEPGTSAACTGCLTVTSPASKGRRLERR
jgi:hypothetical protein